MSGFESSCSRVGTCCFGIGCYEWTDVFFEFMTGESGRSDKGGEDIDEECSGSKQRVRRVKLISTPGCDVDSE